MHRMHRMELHNEGHTSSGPVVFCVVAVVLYQSREIMRHSPPSEIKMLKIKLDENR